MTPHSTPVSLSNIFYQLRHIFPSRRLLTTSSAYHLPSQQTSIPQQLPPLPTISTCPPSGCSCASTPADLAIDHEKQLYGTVPPYAQHVVIRTGRNNWSSRIEDEPHTLGPESGGGNFAKYLKNLVGIGGKFHDPSHPILITNSSEPRHTLTEQYAVLDTTFHTVNLFPQNILLPKTPNTPEGHELFVRNFLRSHGNKDDAFDAMRNPKRYESDQEEGDATALPRSDEIYYQHTYYPTILICGHNSRDTRCGILGPLLKEEFKQIIFGEQRTIRQHEIERNDCLKAETNPSGTKIRRVSQPPPYADVALISHIGGHAFAGNVVIYFPRRWRRTNLGPVSPLAGKGIWYGRVEPRHVWGIMEETVKGGRVIKELLRGVQEPRPDYMGAR